MTPNGEANAVPPRQQAESAPFDPSAITAFTYDTFTLDLAAGTLVMRYTLGTVGFVERVQFEPAPDADREAAARAARLVFLLAGISYYKAAAPPRIELGRHALGPAERAMLDAFYREGLGEYAYRNDLDLGGLTLQADHAEVMPHDAGVDLHRPLVPFGGGIDSIVSVEEVRDRFADTALFVLSRIGDRFRALEDAAAVTQLPIRRAARELDPKILRSREIGYRNGHVPVTGIVSAIANLVAVLDGRGAVVMSNEWSASSGNLVVDGRSINHQYSKGEAFETLLRHAISEQLAPGPEYFSLLRSSSELAIARRFAQLDRYHLVFRSCNRAFHLDHAQRQSTWCGLCDKCCFIDLILAPFLSGDALDAVFHGREPLENRDTLPTFRTLLELGDRAKPFECVGERTECRAAVHLAAARVDRKDNVMLRTLQQELRAEPGALLIEPPQIEALLSPLGPNHIPTAYAPRHLVG